MFYRLNSSFSILFHGPKYGVHFIPLPEENDILKLEQIYNLCVPDDYREFLLNHNGGGFRNVIVSAEGYSSLLNSLHGFNATFSGAEIGEDINLFDDNDPVLLLPIGHTVEGALILLVTDDGEDFGDVCLKFPFKQDYRQISNSFSAFLDSLEPYGEE